MQAPTAPASDLAAAPFRPLAFAPRSAVLEPRPDGSFLLASAVPLAPHPPNVMHHLPARVAAHPDRLLLAERTPDGADWVQLTYAEVWQRLRTLAQALIDRGLGQDTPLMILSGNSLEHLLLTHAAMMVGVPVAPISPSYTLMSSDCAKVRYCFDLVEPRMVFVQDPRPYGKALEVLGLDQPRNAVELVTVAAADGGPGATRFANLLATPPTAAVDRALAATGGAQVAKYLFTSGSTGMPKCVINTHAMMAANHQMYVMVQPPDPDRPPHYLDWLPWNHTMGGNISFPRAFIRGGTFWLDDGRPVAGQFDKTIRNIRAVRPTSFSSVPVAYAWLVQAMEADPSLCAAFFSRLELLSYGGASLPRDLYERMQALAVAETGCKIPFSTGWGCTETAPTATSLYWPHDGTGVIGLPFPGVTLKLVPVDSAAGPEKFEIRIKGPIVFPGYLKRPDLTAAAFDEEGFFRIGDAGRFVEPGNALAGLAFAGRITEDFKLASGTFVHVGTLRTGVVAAASPALQDAVICGHDRLEVALLAWPNQEGCRGLIGAGGADLAPEAVIRHPAVRAHLQARLAAWNAEHPGSSTQVHRLLLLEEPPQVDANEITDKGYINQRAVRERRAALIDRLYAEPADPDILVV